MRRGTKVLASVLLVLCLLLSGTANAEGIKTLPAGTEDLGTIELERGNDADAYYQQLLEAEKYNYRVLRNLPTAFETDEYEAYISLAEKAIRGNRLGDKQRGLLDQTVEMRQSMTRVLARQDVMWELWSDRMPQLTAAEELDFDNCYDNPDFRPVLVPYLLADQQNVKANLIIVAGGGYSGRNNKTEGYPIAAAFNALGYNCFILQRRVTPYPKEEGWLDMQRAIRLVRSEVQARSLGGADCIAAAGFSGGSATVLGSIAHYYGEIQPDTYDPAYQCDMVDSYSGDLDVALCIYGPNYDMGGGTYAGLVTENEHLPAIFLAAGLMDNTGAPNDNLTLAASVMDKTLVEYHAFANAPHGFGVGTAGTNAVQWVALADGFVDQVIAAGGASGTK